MLKYPYEITCIWRLVFQAAISQTWTPAFYVTSFDFSGRQQNALNTTKVNYESKQLILKGRSVVRFQFHLKAHQTIANGTGNHALWNAPIYLNSIFPELIFLQTAEGWFLLSFTLNACVNLAGRGRENLPLGVQSCNKCHLLTIR